MNFFLVAIAFFSVTLGPGAEARSALRAPLRGPQHVPAIEQPGARCELVEQSVLADLPAFCVQEKLDSVRLVDFGNQLELLDKKCGQPEAAAILKKALAEKVHRRRPQACTHFAEELALQSRGARASAAPDVSL